jgi:hypothetical protein
MNVALESYHNNIKNCDHCYISTFITVHLTFIWPHAMVIAAAVVKPEITGNDIKSTKKPTKDKVKFLNKYHKPNLLIHEYKILSDLVIFKGV